jgi:hypothetical protein
LFTAAEKKEDVSRKLLDSTLGIKWEGGVGFRGNFSSGGHIVDSTPFLVCLFMPCSSIPEMDGLFGLFHSFLYAQSAGRLLIPGWGRSHQASCSYPTLFSHPLPLQSFVPLGTTDA